MATGPEGSGYEEIGRQYQSALERAGVQVRLIATAGSLENLRLLSDPGSGVNVALVQGGSISAREAPELESLGTLFYEPLWIFHRGDLKVATTDDLRGLKVSIGPLGSGTRKSLPFGSKVKVINKKNGHAVTVAITDRGPYVKGRCIDVSQAGARALGFAGLAPVRFVRVSD